MISKFSITFAMIFTIFALSACVPAERHRQGPTSEDSGGGGGMY